MSGEGTSDPSFLSGLAELRQERRQKVLDRIGEENIVLAEEVAVTAFVQAMRYSGAPREMDCPDTDTIMNMVADAADKFPDTFPRLSGYMEDEISLDEDETPQDL